MKKYEKMLKNAGVIQYYLNIIDGDEWAEKDIFPFFWYDNDNDTWWLAYHEESGDWTACGCPFWVVKFFVKGRKLRSSLASPMARYYGWRALETCKSGIPRMPKF